MGDHETTDNHEYNAPEGGTRDWHVPLNENWESLDADVEIRDREAALDDYTPKPGAKFFATDSGKVYLGAVVSESGEPRWLPVESSGHNPTFGFVEADLTKTEVLIADRLIADQRLQAMYDANRIRERAGVPTGIRAGIEAEATPGTDPQTPLADGDAVTIESESDARRVAPTGTGTRSDPYLIENRRVVSRADGDEPAGVRIDDPGGQYWVELRNCEIAGHPRSQVECRLAPTGGLRLRNCRLHAADADRLLSLRGGAFVGRAVHFAGLPGGDHAIRLSRRLFAETDVRLRNCLFDEAAGAWHDTTLFGWDRVPSDGPTLEIRHCEFEAPSATGHLLGWNGDYRLVFEHNRVSAWGDASLWEVSIGDGSVVRYCVFEDGGGGRSFIEFNHSHRQMRDAEVAYCEFSGIESRHVFFDPLYDSVIHHCKSTQTWGSGAGTESFETRGGARNCGIEDCWVTEHTEDAFEHVKSRNCWIERCVGDDVAVQIADIHHGVGGVGTPCGSTVRNIYGDCGEQAVQVNGANGVTVSNVFADASVCVRVLGASVDGVAVLGALSLSDSVDSVIQMSTGNDATNCYAVYMDGGRIVTEHSGEGVPDHVVTDVR